MKPLVRGCAYVVALAACNILSGGSTSALLALFIVAAAAIELILPVVAVDDCPEGVCSIAGLRMPVMAHGRVAGLLATVVGMFAAGCGLVFCALQASAKH